MQECSILKDCQREIANHKWIMSERAGYDLGENAIRSWVRDHWFGYLRARWLEHLQGRTFWVELNRDDFGLLQRRFQDQQLLLDRIVDRLKAGRENLDILLWAQDWHLPTDNIIAILDALDVNSLRLVHCFDY